MRAVQPRLPANSVPGRGPLPNSRLPCAGHAPAGRPVCPSRGAGALNVGPFQSTSGGDPLPTEQRSSRPPPPLRALLTWSCRARLGWGCGPAGSPQCSAPPLDPSTVLSAARPAARPGGAGSVVQRLRRRAPTAGWHGGPWHAARCVALPAAQHPTRGPAPAPLFHAVRQGGRAPPPPQAHPQSVANRLAICQVLLPGAGIPEVAEVLLEPDLPEEGGGGPARRDGGWGAARIHQGRGGGAEACRASRALPC